MPKPEEILQEQLRRERLRCESNHLYFTQAFFRHRQGIDFRVNWHHHLISDTVQRVINGELKNVVINVPPGSSKTEIVAINLMARGLALNPRARFLHISYSDDLALLNSGTAKEIIQSDEFQALWPMKVADDAKSKKRWNVEIDGKTAGGVYAVSLGGQITGFRAGHMTGGWQGAIIIDDPLKVDDSYSKTKRDAANRKLVSTVKSRKANPDTPIILIMQRLAEEDPTGFIKAGNMTGEWEFIEIPALIGDEYVDTLDQKYRDLVDADVERDEKGRFSYWPYKEPLEELLEMERGGKGKDGSPTSRYVFSGQYQQRPSPLDGNLFSPESIQIIDAVPADPGIKWLRGWDLASTTTGDWTAGARLGKIPDGRLVIADMVRLRVGPDARDDAMVNTAALDGKGVKISIPQDPGQAGKTQILYLTRKLIGYNVHTSPESGDKVVRAEPFASQVNVGNVMMVRGSWNASLIEEMRMFPNGGNDDQIDALSRAFSQLIAPIEPAKVTNLRI